MSQNLFIKKSSKDFQIFDQGPVLIFFSNQLSQFKNKSKFFLIDYYQHAIRHHWKLYIRKNQPQK